MFIKSYLRAWKNHLKGVSEEYRLDLYQTLSLLESETDVAVFQKRLDKFSQCWEGKAPAFIQYFQEYYANRPGRCNTYIHSNMWVAYTGHKNRVRKNCIGMNPLLTMYKFHHRKMGSLLQTLCPCWHRHKHVSGKVMSSKFISGQYLRQNYFAI